MRALLIAVVLIATAPPARAAASDGDQYLVVDCLLPGQIRRLGRRLTYTSARRAVKTSAEDCRIRGGEYVAYDRADYRTALAVWLPLAEGGDTEAQVYVAAILEQGLGTEPDYEAAAGWYRRAADNGSVRAQIALAHLYEQGLGVRRDPEASIAWYRRAAGAGSEVVLAAPGPGRDARADIAALEHELAALIADNRRLEITLDEARAALARTAASTDTAALERQVTRLGNLLVQRDEQMRRLAAEHASVAAALATSGRQRDRLETELAAATSRREATIETLREELAQRETAARGFEARLAALDSGLAATDAAVSVSRAAVRKRLVEGPSVTVIEPELPVTRGLVPVTVAAVGIQQVIGRVRAPAGLLSLTVNGTRVAPNDAGVFLTEVPVMRAETRVDVVAVDNQGKRTDVTFRLRSRTAEGVRSTPPSPAVRFDDIEFGRYHALVIGNNAYRHLPDLDTAVNDARAIAALLESRYGFETRLLLNADRYQILSALNDLRETLTPKDNLLLYYAGHGELDEINHRGHWLPVDAEPDSTANWISNVAVTDVLNALRAKQVLLIADSCYAASLTRSAIARMRTGMTAAEQRNWVRTMAGRRARLVLTSGGLAPVLDAGGGGHSVFARALLEVLADNTTLLNGRRLHQQVAARVAYAAANLDFEQVPEYAPIRHAGHEAGAFFLLPR